MPLLNAKRSTPACAGRRNASSGFTLIELLVVIAIIGLLASVVFASLGTARKNGRIAASQGNLRSILASWIVCFDGGGFPNIPTESDTGGAGALCTTSATSGTYPKLPPGWIYCDGSESATTLCGSGAADKSTAPTSAAPTTAMVLKAKGDATTITCDENGCSKL